MKEFTNSQLKKLVFKLGQPQYDFLLERDIKISFLIKNSPNSYLRPFVPVHKPNQPPIYNSACTQYGITIFENYDEYIFNSLNCSISLFL